MSRRKIEVQNNIRRTCAYLAAAATDARAANNVGLHYTLHDDRAFINVAAQLVTSTAEQCEISRVNAVHIDNWFGPRWLGFCGKIYGRAGVRNRTLKRSLSIPPFHPHRVIAARGHRRRRDGMYADVLDIRDQHPNIPSQLNIFRAIARNTLYAWYSGNTLANKRGVLMIYFRHEDRCQAFYTMFEHDSGWRLAQQFGITAPEVCRLLRSTSPTEA